MKKYLATAFAGLFALGSANAAIINLDSTDSGNGVDLILGPGTYSVNFVQGEFSSWNPWGNRTTDCDENGRGCTRGWGTKLTLSTFELGSMNIGSPANYATAQLGLAGAPLKSFTLGTRQVVRLFIADSNYGDNQGGLSFSVMTENGTLVGVQETPIPAAGFLFAGAAIVAGLRRRFFRG